MANTFTIAGAPKLTNVMTEAALKAAISAAKPGEVITLTQTVTPFALTLDKPKASPGICVVLPQDQKVALTLAARELRTELIGGTITNHPTTVTSSASKYSVFLTGASHFAIRGGTIGLAENICVSGSLASDFVFEALQLEWPTVDFFQLGGCSRAILKNLFARKMIKGQKMRWFSDGRAPVDNVGQQANPGVTNGWWDDTQHNDGAQIRSNATSGNTNATSTTAVPSTDFVLDNIDMWILGAGLVNYDYNPYNDLGKHSNERMIVKNCDIRSVDVGAINYSGKDIALYDNKFGSHPTSPGPSQVKIALKRFPNDPSSRIRGGNNVAVVNPNTPGDAPYFDSPIDLAGAPNGDATVDPIPPAFGVNRLPWAPSFSRPAYADYTGAPVVMVAPKVYWWTGSATMDSTVAAQSQVAPSTGTWLTVGQGATMGFENSTGEYQWKANGTVVGTGRTYQVKAADSGKTITAETRRTNTNGTGPWAASLGVVIAGTFTPTISGTLPDAVIGQPYDGALTVSPANSAITLDNATATFIAAHNITHDGFGRFTSANVT